MTRSASSARPLAAVLAAVLAVGCGGASSYPVTRRLGGEPVTGVFVSPFSYEHYVRGELAIATGDLQTAAEELELARAGPDEDPLVMARLADVLDQLDRHEDADRVLTDALERFPDAESPWLARGAILERRGEIEPAIDALEHAERAAPRSELAPLALAKLLRAHDAEGRAEAVLTRFVRRSGGTAGAFRAALDLALTRNDAEGAVRAVRDLMRVAPVRADEVTRVARAALEGGRPVLAASLLDGVPPERADVVLRVRALHAAGRTSAAEAALASATDDAVGGPLGRAELSLAVGRPDQALALAEAESLREESPRAWLIIGLASLALEQPDDAARALARIPRDASVHDDAARALARALDESGLDGLAAEILAHDVSGASHATRDALAALRLARGDADGALEAWSGLDDATARAARARIAERAGRDREALEAWRRVPPDARELDSPSRLRARAERLVAAGHDDEAIRALRALVDEAPEDVWSAARLAELLAGRGAHDEARALVERVAPLAADAVLRARLEAIGRL